MAINFFFMNFKDTFIKAVLATFLICPKFLLAETVTMPSSLTADTSDFVTLADSGTTPSISGFTGTLLVTVVASDGNVKITTTSSLLQASGYCGYSADNAAEPSDCNGNSLTEIGFRGTQANINTALATLAFKGDGTAGSPTVTVAVTPAGTNYYSGTGHYYEVVSATKTWRQAKALAAASTYKGLTGYLVTITSAGENAFIKAKVNADSWIGASDANDQTTGDTNEGHWQWVTGPEAGKTYFCDGEVDGCTVDVGYSYSNWNTNEPNNSGEEEVGQFYTGSGKWNDLPGKSTDTHTQTAYIIEYGGLEGASATISATTTLTINSIEARESTFDAFDDKELKGIVKEVFKTEQRPEKKITLDFEHSLSMSALKFLQASLRTFYEVIIDISKKLFPDNYHRITPQIFRLHTWVGYDVDGRGDIFWSDSFSKRLKVKVEQLDIYQQRVNKIIKSCLLYTSPSPRD